jgi:hypothetical protein
VGDERAETYLELRAEAELRRRLRSAVAGSASGLVSAADVTASIMDIRWAGEVLRDAGVLPHGTALRIAAELEVALAVRAQTDPRRLARRLDWAFRERGDESLTHASRREYHGPARPMRVVALGRTLPIHDERAPCDLHLMTLVSTPSEAVITVAQRMHWPADGSSADLEVLGAGIQHLPFGQLAAVDDQDSRYRLRFSVGDGGADTWSGLIMLSPAPPPEASWLDLVADETRLIRLDLRPDGPAQAAAPAEAAIEQIPGVAAGEHLLAAEAEAIMASAWDTQGPEGDRRLGELTRLLAEAGAIAADSKTPGQLAALCERLGITGLGITGLGITGLGITAEPAAQLPGRWASVLAQRDAAPAGRHQEIFAPLGTLLPDLEGTRFALAGLTSAGGESYLDLVAVGLPERAGAGPYGWASGFGWWLRDDTGGWHTATGNGAALHSLGEAAAIRLRLVPPLASRPDTLEVVVTGASTRLRAVVPVGGEGDKQA